MTTMYKKLKSFSKAKGNIYDNCTKNGKVFTFCFSCTDGNIVKMIPVHTDPQKSKMIGNVIL